MSKKTIVFDAETEAAVQSLSTVDLAAVKSLVENSPASDASETMTFARQLEYVKSRIYKKQYAELKGKSLVPISREAGPNKEYVVERVWDMFTMAKLVTNYSTDFDTVAAVASEVFLKFHDFGNGYEYSVRDIELANSAGVPLDSMSAEAARMGHELALDEAIAIGVPQVKAYGLANHPSVPLLTLPTGTWASATGEQILADLNSIVTQMLVTTLELHAPDTILMSVTAFRLLVTKMVNSAAGTMTVLSAFREQNPGIRVEGWTKLALANAGATNGRIIAYKNDPYILEMELGEAFRVYPPTVAGLMIKYPCLSRFAGIHVKQPLAMAYFDSQTM